MMTNRVTKVEIEDSESTHQDIILRATTAMNRATEVEVGKDESNLRDEINSSK